MTFWLLAVLLVLTSAWLVVRIRSNKIATEEEKLAKSTTPTGAYHAVSLLYSEHACSAAQEMTGRRFLSSAAPRLPLPGCNNVDCRCQFAHHDDRRKGDDRRSPFAPGGQSGATGAYQQERRVGQERRKS